MKKTLSRSKTFESDLTKLDKRLQRQSTLPSFHHVNEFDYKRDAKFLCKILKQCITAHTLDLEYLLNYFSPYNCEQRLILIHDLEYEYNYKLIDMVLERPASPIRSCVLAMLIEPIELYVRDFHEILLQKQTGQIMEDISKDLLEILLTLNNDETKKFTEIYENLFENSTTKDIELVQGEQSLITKLLIDILKGKRLEEPLNSPSLAKTIAKKLYEAEQGTSSIDYDTFIKIFTRDAFSQLSTIFDFYEDRYKKPIEEAIDKNFSGKIERECFRDMIEFIRSPSIYYSKILNRAIEANPIDYVTLIRTIIGHEDKDLCEINLEYSKLFDKTLEENIQNQITFNEIRSLFLSILRKHRDQSSCDDNDEPVRFDHVNNSDAFHQSTTQVQTQHISEMRRNRSHEAFDKLVQVFKTKRH